MMNEHRKRLDKHVLTARAQALFALAAAERLRGCCWSFEKEYGSSMEPFFRWSALLFDQIGAGAALSRDEVLVATQEVESIAPSSDEYGSSLAVQAQSGALCLLSALLVISGDERNVVVGVANSVIDALDNFTYFSRKQILSSEEAPDSYELLRREMSRQLHDVEMLRDSRDRGLERLMEWRFENRQFTVPSAI